MPSCTEEVIAPTVFIEDERIRYSDSTFEIISKVAYLIGVPKHIFENEYEPPELKIYQQLDLQKNARIVRNLCMVRTAIERNFGKINERMKTSFSSIFSMPEYVPSDVLSQLSNDGIRFHSKVGEKLCYYIIEINKILSDRVNNCKSLFPVWLNWDYIRDLFIMEDGLTEQGTKAAANVYFEKISCYPYSVFINWRPQERGNILYNDKKFVTMLYEWHNDYFEDTSKVSDAGSFVKRNIYSFIDEAEKVIMAVDCENSDPYRLCATLKGLEADTAAKIQKIMLFDDVHTVKAWGILESFTEIPVEHIMTERVKRTKSLVDIELTAMTCKEHYRNGVDSFVIVSSDSDYWGLINNLPEARFLMMVEREKCGPDIKAALAKSGIFYCYLDDFYSGDENNIKKNALFTELYRTLDESLQLNAKTMLDDALTATRIDMSPAERRQFYDKYIRNMKINIDDDGNVSLELNRK